MLDHATRRRFDELARRLGAEGCDPHEIDHVQADQGVPLPASYRYFLQRMGRNVGGLYFGSAFAVEEIGGIRQLAVDMIEESTLDFALPPDAVVISEHQGYQFLYLLGREGADPRVWRWIDSSEQVNNPAVVAASLVDLLEGAESATH